MPALLKGVPGPVVPDVILNVHLAVILNDQVHPVSTRRTPCSGFGQPLPDGELIRWTTLYEARRLLMLQAMRPRLPDRLPTDQGIVGTENHPKYGPRNGPMNCPMDCVGQAL